MAFQLEGFRALSQIGVGARSVISKVLYVPTGEFFALKRVSRRSKDDDPFIRQAEIEFDVSSSVSHPFLRRSIEIYRIKKLLKIKELVVLMEWVPGRTLEQSRPQDFCDTLALFRKVAEGLDALHAAGFVHADIKPNNILRTEDDGIKIIDFGQSCPVGHKKDRIQGTPDYIAPEQVRKLPLDPRTDVFNLGATLYWALTEKTFPTDIRQGAAGKHEITGTVRTPKELNPAIPGPLSTLVMECCALNPKDRPDSMKRVIARLDFVAGRACGRGANQSQQTNGKAPATDPEPKQSTRTSVPGADAWTAPAHTDPGNHADR